MDLNTILTIGEDILLNKTFIIRSEKRGKRDLAALKTIKRADSFDPRNYMMLEHCNNKQSQMISLYNYYTFANPDYYNTYSNNQVRKSLESTTFTIDDGVVDYGREEFDKCSSSKDVSSDYSLIKDMQYINDGVKKFDIHDDIVESKKSTSFIDVKDDISNKRPRRTLTGKYLQKN